MDPRTTILSRRVPAGEEPFALCLGLVASDFVARTSFPIPRDRKVRVGGFVRQGGGPAANAAVCLARLGMRTAFLGAVGDDAMGRAQVEELSREGIDVSGVVTSAGTPSFVSFILVDESDGSRTIFSAPPARPLPPAGLSLPDPRPHLVLLDGWAGPAGLSVARAAREEGIPVLLDAGSYREEVADLLPFTEIAIASTPFAEGMTGGGNLESALAMILARGPRLAAVTRGREGVIASARGAGECFSLPAFPTEVLDTTGAGDAFHGGAAWGLLQGRPWLDCLRIAGAVAALKCRRAGARRGLPRRAELEAFLGGRSGESVAPEVDSPAPDS